MTFTEIYSGSRPVLSFEFFPPKKRELLNQTLELIAELNQLKPDLITVTYGAGGGTRGLTREIVSYVHSRLHTIAVAHLTCINHTKDEIKQVVSELEGEGIRHILALRGDTPKQVDNLVSPLDSFHNAKELTEFLKSKSGFNIAVAGYPETHKDASSADADLEYLKSKVDAGAEVIYTQLFFEPQIYFDFVKRARSIGIHIPIVPGIMPISNTEQLKRFTSMCGASIPEKVTNELTSIGDNRDEIIRFGIDFSISLCQELINGGAPGIHIYTLNNSRQVAPIVKALKF
jgi:methylenetetrahydrofolate reductase (NADPH)